MGTFREIKTRARMAVLATCGGLALGTVQPSAAKAAPRPTTPIQHVVVIFQENVSFDHYFATYPNATNPRGEPSFTAGKETPSVNGLSGSLLTNNPNANNPLNTSVSPMGAAPFRLDRSQAATCDQDHYYLSEQQAFDLGLMDAFPYYTGMADCSSTIDYAYGRGQALTMGYFDGNTVTAMWNYAQNFAMSDNFYGTSFGPSAVGALNLVSGQTGGVIATLNNPSSSTVIDNTVIGNPWPLGDACSRTLSQAQLGGTNIGDLLNKAGLTWGWFAGGFNLSIINPNGTTGCNRSHNAATGGTIIDYLPHHEPFQFYASTANLTHARPTSYLTIGRQDAANHQYDINDFYAALLLGNLPAVSFIKAPSYLDGHAGYSSPLLEQGFVVTVINTLEKSSFWRSTAVIIAYDDSDGWYDHQMSPIVNPSATSKDALSGAGLCGNGTPLDHIQGRCAHGPRLPLLIVSGYAKANFVDGTLTDQTSILRFIEDNWRLGRIGGGSFDALAGSLNNMFDFTQRTTRTLILNPLTGQPTAS